MAGKRTKAQKRQAAERRLEPAQSQHELEALDQTKALARSLEMKGYSLPAAAKNRARASTMAAASATAFFGYDVKLIYQDLFRTVVVTSIVISLLLIVSRYL